LLLISCKVARLPEVQHVPRHLRLRTAVDLVSCTFEELPAVCEASDVLYPGSDPCLQWDEIIGQLSTRVEQQVSRRRERTDTSKGKEKREEGEERVERAGQEQGDGECSAQSDLIRAVVEVIFGDSLVADFTDEMITAMMPDEGEGTHAFSTAQGAQGEIAALMASKGLADDVDRREELLSKWSARLERPFEELEGALPWPVRKPLCAKQYEEFELLHAHYIDPSPMCVANCFLFPFSFQMRLMLAQALDALVLDVIERVLDELNLYSHECATLALMAGATAEGRCGCASVCLRPCLKQLPDI
ncbi:MAG: hypothetical protein SGPRY_004052, partial [Prymnesium sp.]